MSRRKLTLIIFGVLLLALVGPFVAITRDSSTPEQRVHQLDKASLAAKNFIDNYVMPDGTVGQGGISDSLQAQGMLIAAATADRSHFEAMANAFSSVDRPANLGPPSASDLLRIRAYSVAADRLGDAKYDEAAKQMVAAIPAMGMPSPQNSTADVMQLRTFDDMAKLTGDERWIEGVATGFRLSLAKTLDTQKLPLDASSGTAADHYGKLAQMIPLWLKDSCDPQDAQSAKKIWLALRDSPITRVATALSADGKVVDGSPSATAAAATAAAAEVAGEHVQSAQLLDQADVIAEERNDVESAAAAAIGRIVVDTDWLGVCG